ncbi:MAG: hypothetical protein CMJ84_02380 [Planctomycetes bacterium]|jgi:transcriptional regulator with XRE-family HTH domain|nr:hypothetical protein [Planctomycetota bacterium]MDP6408415.1 helix-turn-helix transcriptional regulator [Planctomycetota bacterium]
MTIGKALKRIRRERKLTQAQVARDAGIPGSYLSRIENDRIQPTTGTLSRVSAALSVPLSRIFALEEQAGRPVIPHCPVSTSGRCIGDLVRSLKAAPPSAEELTYGSEDLRTLRMANYLVLSASPDIRRALTTVLESFVDRSSPSSMDALLPDDLAEARREEEG